ncbi:uncharacterized protein LOC108630362 [Ceratina calcarata]|nr:uncharacterized protein LOC108630362 [Ceratina calcarata]
MEGRSVGILKRRRNRLALDQNGIHNFTILTVTPAKNTRQTRPPTVVEITEDDFVNVPKEGAEQVKTTVNSNASLFIKETIPQREEINPFDIAGDEYILSTNVNYYQEMEISMNNDPTINKGAPTASKPNVTLTNSPAQEKEEITSKQNVKENNTTNKDNETDFEEDLLRISLPIEEPTENTSATLKLYNRKEGNKIGNNGAQGKIKHDRNHRKHNHRNGSITSNGTIIM